ncbi:MAG: DUF1819 family protein [Smithella sp.]|nr:DUF1819 family protein [Smithella sp.]
MNAERNYTTQLGAGLGLIPETMALIRLWSPGMNANKLADLAIETGLFSRATARRARNIVAEMFAPRYLTEEGAAAFRIKYLIEKRLPQDALEQIFFLYTARAQQIFRDFVVEVYWPKYAAGAHYLTKDDAEQFIHRALDTGRMCKRWSDEMVKRVSGYLIGCCVDFGLVTEQGRSKRAIQRFAVRKDVALYLVHDLHFSGLSDMATMHHQDWLLFGLEAQEVINQMKNLSQDGHLLIQSMPDLVQISWKYQTMEECLVAITKR